MCNDQQAVIEQEFVASWDKIETLYRRYVDNGRSRFKPLCALITELREKGYDKRFRAGTQLSCFVLSRSREWGLRKDQASVGICANSDGSMVLQYSKDTNASEIEIERIALTEELQELLDKLLQAPID